MVLVIDMLERLVSSLINTALNIDEVMELFDFYEFVQSDQFNKMVGLLNNPDLRISEYT
jgi:hypothetical protein